MSEVQMGDNGTEDDYVRGFSAIKLGDDVRRDAWVIFRDDKDPSRQLAYTRGQWMDQTKGVLPTNEQFSKYSYAIHASLTGNEELMVKGKFGDHDLLPPQLFVKKIKLSPEDQQEVDKASKKDRWKRKFALQAKAYRKIAAEIGVPPEIPERIRKLEGKERVFHTKGGGAQPCAEEFDYPIRAGGGIHNLQVWKGQEILEVAWHRQDGNGPYDGGKLSDALPKIKAKHEEGVEVVLKSDTNRSMGVLQLDHYGENGGEKRWAAQVRKPREINANFAQLTAIVSYGDGRESCNMDVKWLAINQPDSPLTEGLLDGSLGHHLRMVVSGGGRTSIQFAMQKYRDETTKLLDEVGIPLSVTHGRPGDYKRCQAAGKGLPAISVPYSESVDGPPPAGVNVMDKYGKDQIMIAGRDRDGDRTGFQRTLLDYEEKQLRLPDDAAKALGLEPDVYSKGVEKSSQRYDQRPNDRQKATPALDF